jgi:hypothetical protein
MTKQLALTLDIAVKRKAKTARFTVSYSSVEALHLAQQYHDCRMTLAAILVLFLWFGEPSIGSLPEVTR